MPWSETSPMNERTRFVADYLNDLYSMAELCRRYGISRKTGYKWVDRMESEGPAGLHDRSRRPHTCPHTISEDVARILLETRRRHPTWGAKKLIPFLQERYPRVTWPATSTTANLLERHGLVARKRRRRPLGHPGRPDTPMNAPNDIWTADFKGHFRTGNGLYCYPLTVADGFSRYLLACQALDAPTHDNSLPIFKRLFHEYGLPSIIRTDNGVPFATTTLARLSRLSVWWIRLGIYPELIQPGSPQQNGRHERMHRTLKKETAMPPASSHPSQQRRFTYFRREFNHLRPHEALGQKTPESHYQHSPRPMPKTLPEIQYPPHYELRRVSYNGGIRWCNQWVNVTQTLGDQNIGLEEIDIGLWNVYYGTLHLGRFHEKEGKIEDHLGRKERKHPRNV